MQAVLNSNAGFGPMSRLQFVRGRSYMMRSEKRGGNGPAHRSPDPGKKPRRNKRRRAGFFYKLFMMLLLLTLWPVGLMMLWRRKVRWGVITKLLTSIVTLAACIILIGFALTVNTTSESYTAVQDSINSFLDTAADTLVDFGGIVEEKAGVVYEGVTDMADALWVGGRTYVAEGIEYGITITQQMKMAVEDLIATFSDEADPQADPALEDGPTSTLEAIETAEPQEAAEPAEITVNTDASSLPVYIPDATPDPAAASAVEEGILTHEGELEASPEEAALPVPTVEPLKFTIKSAAAATVYYNEGGKCYHKTASCGSMQSAAEHTLGETIGVNNHRCVDCNTPEKTILDEEHIVWIDAERIAHLSDECPEFTGSWQLVPAAQANEDGLTACAECSADLYLRAVAAELDVVIVRPEAATESGEPSAEATADSAQATANPAMQQVAPATALKPAGEATVYHSLDSKMYHTFNRCSGMTGGGKYSLAECADDYIACRACGAPDAQLVDQICLWQDESGLCHTSDECASFDGKYALVLRDDALARELEGCSACGANDYLLPGTAISSPEPQTEAVITE